MTRICSHSTRHSNDDSQSSDDPQHFGNIQRPDSAYISEEDTEYKTNKPRSVALHIATLGLKFPIHIYRYTLSPLIGRQCRFLPTCSEYALEALDRHGPINGSRLAIRRIFRCNPFGGHGHDPVPLMQNKNMTTSSHPHKIGRFSR